MPLLEIEDLKIYYRSSVGISQAVDGISFSLKKGQSLGLVGESGCGKTTAVRGIIRIMDKNAYIADGKIIFNGEDLVGFSEDRMRNIRWKDLSLIPQAAMNSLNPVYPVIDAFNEILLLKGGVNLKAAEKRAEELFLMVGLDPKRLHHYPHEFSGGMKQRAIIALALALNPKLIIADEPVTALDVIVQNQVLTELKKLREKLKVALIIITHDISVVAQTCNMIAVMYAGKIVEKGTSIDILKNAAHPYTLGLENAFPNLRNPDKSLIAIEGSPPNLVNPPKGCRFASRCPFKIQECQQKEPVLKEVNVGHYSACFRLNEIEEIRKKAREGKTWTTANS
jgi:peptide/nickel transport system ATP-binding protein